MAEAEQVTDEATLRAAAEANLATGERFSAADGLALLDTDDLSWLGGLAHRARGAAVGDRTAFGPSDALSAARPGGEPADARPAADTDAYSAAEGAGGSTDSGGNRVAVIRYDRGTPAADLVAALVRVREAADAEPVRLAVLVRGRAADESEAVSPAESMKLTAVARLLLDNVADLGCDLASHPLSTTQLMQHFGASALLVPAADLDATAIAESIWDAGFTPVQVDAAGAEIRDFGPPTPQARRRAEPQSVFS